MIEQRIFFLRGHKVMLSTDLAERYQVQPRLLVQAVKRNIDRFPPDFMFQLTQAEFTNLKSQIVTSSWGGLRRATPYAFTEQGVAMLSSVLRSKRAVQANIEIMRAFVRLRRMLSTHAELGHKIDALEKKYDEQFKVVFDANRQLMASPGATRRRIGFRAEDDETGTGILTWSSAGRRGGTSRGGLRKNEEVRHGRRLTPSPRSGCGTATSGRCGRGVWRR